MNNELETRKIVEKVLREEHLLGLNKIFEKEHNLFRGSHDKIALPEALAIPQEIVDEGPAGAVVNLERVAKMDSANLAVILACYVSLAKRGVRLVLLNAERSLGRMLAITRLDSVLEKYNDEDEAVEAFKEASLPG